MKIPPIILVYLAVGIITAVTVYLVFKRIGLIEDLTKEEKKIDKKTKEELAKEEQDINLANVVIHNMPAFDPRFYEKANKSSLLNEVQARQIAGKIRSCFGFFNDDESGIYAAFRSLSNQYQVSQVSFYYAANFNKDLVTDLEYYLNNKELNNVVKIVSNLPKS